MKNILKKLKYLDNATGDVYSIELFSDGSGTLLCYKDSELPQEEVDKYVFSFADLEDLMLQLDEVVGSI